MSQAIDIGFDQVTAVHARGDGRYATSLNPAWDGPFSASGGLIAAGLLRAVQAELNAPELIPRMVSVHYVAATTSGPAEITVLPLRVGQRSAVLQAHLRQNETLTATAVVTCSATREAETGIALSDPPPRVAPVEAVPELAPETLDGAPRSLQRLRLWPCLGVPILSGSRPAVTGGWIAFRDDPDGQPVDASRLVALCDMWWPAVFGASRTLVGVPTLALSIQLHGADPAAAPVLARYATTTLAEGHLDETAGLWSADGRPLANGRQVAQIRPTWSRS